MKLKITQDGVHANGAAVPVGTIVEISGDIVPASLVGKSVVVDPLDHDGDGKAGGAAPNNPPSERDELKKQADELGIEYAKNISTDKLRELIDAKLAA